MSGYQVVEIDEGMLHVVSVSPYGFVRGYVAEHALRWWFGRDACEAALAEQERVRRVRVGRAGCG